MSATVQSTPLFDGSEWTFDLLDNVYDAIEEIATEDLGLDTYPNQVEIISAEQMLDAHSSVGMPLMYLHWSFGKRFVQEEKLYRKGFTGLAYEIVINSNPCISYNMEQNSMPIQTLVIAHAAFGHNHFFKNNYLFQQWTDADGILDYIEYSKKFIAKCEEEHGIDAVEGILDAAHALMDHGVSRYARPSQLTEREREKRNRERADYEARTFNDLWRTLPASKADEDTEENDEALAARVREMRLPEENLVYFIETYSPILEPWQRELLAIVQYISQYFYPQKQTKVMNEGCATFVHHYIVNALFDKGLLTEGAMLEILHSHSSVVNQADYDDPRYGGINPYALGFNMMRDIKRICTEPRPEDTEWFPEIAGCGDWRGVLKDAWANYRDESFIRQFLSPRLIRSMRLFTLCDNAEDRHFTVEAIHNERGYRKIRETVARSYDIGVAEPVIQITDADLRGDRTLHLEHNVRDRIPLAEKSREEVLKHIRRLWGYEVSLKGVDQDSGDTIYESSVT
jgi:spore cortex formation protein SpoVR/YcgB (stage V sporulation)